MPLLPYLDNNLVSAIARCDLDTSEMEALLWILGQNQVGRLPVVTSEVSRREIARLEGESRPPVETAYELLQKVPFVEDHRVLGFHSQFDRWGGYTQPLVEDDPVSTRLRQIGLDRTDAHHLMVAIRAGCTVFLTCDRKSILIHKAAIEKSFPIRVLRPSAFVAELRDHVQRSQESVK